MHTIKPNKKLFTFSSLKINFLKIVWLLFFFSLIFTFSYANTTKEDSQFICKIPKEYMLTLLATEQSQFKLLDYPFIIRSNYKDKSKKQPDITDAKNKNFLVSQMILKGKNNKALPIRYRCKKNKTGWCTKKSIYAYDCLNLKQCIETVQLLNKYGMDNFDIGPFQMNYKFHKYSLESLFNLDGAYNNACKYASTFVNKYGLSLHSMAMYHSQTEEFHKLYLSYLETNFERVNKSLSKIERDTND